MTLKYSLATFGGVNALALAVSLTTATAQTAPFDAEAYFKGKTIEVVINARAGGGLDTSTRFILQGFSGYVPGKPRFNPINIPETPGISAVYDAPVSDDRITIGLTTRAATLYASTLDVAATHDPAKLQIAGGFGGNPISTLIFNDAAKAYNSIKDASGAKGPELVFAGMVGDATGLVASPFYVSWLCDTFTLPCRMVTVADDNTNMIVQDIQRGQINIMDSTTANMIRTFNKQLVSGEAKILVERAEEGSSEITSPYARPDIREFLPNEQAKTEFAAILPLLADGGVGNAIFVGPNVPAEAVQAIGDAFVKKMSEPANMAQTIKVRFGNFPDHSFTPSLIGPADAQRLYEASLGEFKSNQDFYKTKQESLYDKYWK